MSIGLALATALGSTSACAAISGSERQALIDLYDSTTGSGWSSGADATKANVWKAAAGTECDWYGVTCDAAKTHVIALNLQFNNLEGSVPSASLAALPELTVLNLSQNGLTGSIPSLAGLSKLGMLILEKNKLTGEIPPLTGLGSLTQFRVGNNQLTGSTPALAGLVNLQTFDAHGNQLDGQIGALAGATLLNTFDVNANQLSGPIPDLSGLAQLQRFFAQNNKLTSIGALAGLANLVTFDASSNQLSGPIPSLAGLGKLQNFYVTHNQLSGPIPALTDLVGIRALYLDDNRLTGQIPSLDRLTSLVGFHVDKNQLVGSPPMPPNAVVVAVMCPNPLRRSQDEAVNQAWDNLVPNKTHPWENGCTGSFDVTPMVRDPITGDPVTGGGTGTISPNTLQILPANGSMDFTLSHAPGYHLRLPIGGSCPGSRNGNVFTAGPVAAACTVEVTFVPDELAPVDGVCGSDNGKALSVAPTNLCSVGAASAVAGTGPWTWSCTGVGDGATAQCAAQKAAQTWTVTAVVNGSGGTALPATQSVANGARATVSGVPDSGYALATATGCGGATISGNTATTAAVTADCTLTLTFAPGAHATTTQFVNLTPSSPRVGDGVAVSVRVSDAAAPALGALSGAAVAARNVSPSAIPAGAVTVSGGGASCVASLDGAGNGQCNLHFATAGVHQLTATYPGSAAQGHLPSSAVYTVTVSAAQNLSPASAPLLDRVGLLLLGLLLCGGVLWRRARS